MVLLYLRRMSVAFSFCQRQLLSFLFGLVYNLHMSESSVQRNTDRHQMSVDDVTMHLPDIL